MIDVDIAINVYKAEIQRLMDENMLLKMQLVQKEKDDKEKDNEEQK